MNLTKIISIILSIFAIVLGIYLYLTREEVCAEEQPWWLVLVLIGINALFLIYALISGKKTADNQDSFKSDENSSF